jgi:hypothetical protein
MSGCDARDDGASYALLIVKLVYRDQALLLRRKMPLLQDGRDVRKKVIVRDVAPEIPQIDACRPDRRCRAQEDQASQAGHADDISRAHGMCQTHADAINTCWRSPRAQRAFAAGKQTRPRDDD